jgi:tetratricopeptide (TPR) repeat protein
VSPDDDGQRRLAPSAEECRGALASVLASPAFQASPQLAAFLRFVVEATLSGQSDRIKGYTIGLEALGRAPDFDPQSDPIVRVEAGRLRRALDAYYAVSGAADPIAIALPVGSYVPVFTRRDPAPSMTLEDNAAAPPTPWWRQRAALWAAAVAVAAMFVGFAALRPMSHGGRGGEITGSIGHATIGSSGAQRSAFGLPIVEVEPVAVIGMAAGLDPDILRQRIQNTLARFDAIRVRIDPAVPASARGASADSHGAGYRLAVTIDMRLADAPQLMMRLLDDADHSVVWSKTYRNLGAGGDQSIGSTVLLDLSSALLGPDGIIQPNERRKRTAGLPIDSRYSCILDAYEYWQHYKAHLHSHVRSCLEGLSAAEPQFSLSFALLTYVYLREHYFVRVADRDDVAATDRAFHAARRAVTLRPSSALAYHALSAALFGRNNIEEGLATAKKAVELNPYNVIMISGLGFRLVRAGQIDRGLALLRQAEPYRTGLSSWYAATMSIGSYFSKDFATAARFDLAAITDTFPPGLIATALVAAKSGKPDRARQAVERLIALDPVWRDDPRRELAKIFHAPWMVDRIAGDLAPFGLGAQADVTGATAHGDGGKLGQ